jgi:Ca2+-transporting ATPase
MKRKPRDPNEGIFAGGLGINVIVQGVFIGLVTILAYLIGNYIDTKTWGWIIGDSSYGMTMAFLTLSLTESFHSFNARSINNSIFSVKKQNKYLWGAFILSILLTVCVVFIPGLNSIFGFESITLVDFVISAGLAFLIVPFTELLKVIKKIAK